MFVKNILMRKMSSKESKNTISFAFLKELRAENIVKDAEYLHPRKGV